MYCIDASVLVNSFVEGEEFHQDSERLIEMVKTKEIPVILPEIVLPEVASAITRGIGDSKIALEFIEKLEKIPIFIFIPIDREVASLASKFAAEYMLRGCDAIYIAIAKLFNAKLITLDNQQRENGSKCAIVLYPKEELNNLNNL